MQWDSGPYLVTVRPLYGGSKYIVQESVERLNLLLCGGYNGGLSGLWKAIEIEWLYVSLGSGILNKRRGK